MFQRIGDLSFKILLGLGTRVTRMYQHYGHQACKGFCRSGRLFILDCIFINVAQETRDVSALSLSTKISITQSLQRWENTIYVFHFPLSEHVKVVKRVYIHLLSSRGQVFNTQVHHAFDHFQLRNLV